MTGRWTEPIQRALDEAHDRLVPTPDHDPTAWAPLYLRARSTLELLAAELTETDQAHDRLAEILHVAPHAASCVLVEAVEQLVRSQARAASVYAAAIAWRRQVNLVPATPHTQALLDAIDAAIEAEKTPKEPYR